MNKGALEQITVIPSGGALDTFALNLKRFEQGFVMELGCPEYSNPWSTITFDHGMGEDFSKALKEMIAVSSR